MKIRAKAELIEQFLNEYKDNGIVLVSKIGAWSTIEIAGSFKKNDDYAISQWWKIFNQRRSADFEEKMIDTLAQETGHVTQKSYNGNIEKLPAARFTIKIKCTCGEIRYIQPCDAFQVTKCKPCTMKERKKRQYENRKARRELEKEEHTLRTISKGIENTYEMIH